MFKLFNFLVLVAIFCELSVAIEDYCSIHTINHFGNSLRFTKEPANEEFAIVGKFKGLHCCAKGYNRIEWFKDGQAYPWGLDLSTLIIYPESANQTIYTLNIKENDSGNYTCILRNDNGNITEIGTHTINLKVFNKLPDDLKITYVSKDLAVFGGDSTRLFCEAFGGTIDLPDAHSEVVWQKLLLNGSIIEVPKEIQQVKILREEGQTFGTYLEFPDIQSNDFGTYICVITKPGNTIRKIITINEKIKYPNYLNRNPFPLREALIVSAIIVLILTFLLILLKQYGLKAQVFLKDSYGNLEENDGKTLDVHIGFCSKDSNLILGVLVPNLESRGYRCNAKEYFQQGNSNNSNWINQLSQELNSARRLIVILSPACFNETWTASNIYQTLKELQALNSSPQLICVAIKELPTSRNDTKNSLGETLASVAKLMNVLTWERSNDTKFWLNLCKNLPAKRENRKSRQRSTSEKSIDSLMVV